MDNNRILSLLGLALRGGNLVVGEEPVETAAETHGARLILLASDAAAGTCRKAERLAQTGNCLLVRLPFTKEELGRAVGRSSAAVAALTDIGLAAAVGRRLAELDPAKYGALLERLEIKSKRAAERKAEQRIRDKEARRTPKKPPEQAEKSRPKRGAPPEKAASRPKRPGSPGKPPERPPKTAKTAPDGKASFRRKPDSRTTGKTRPKPRAKPYAHSRPVKKGKGSFRKREG